MTLTTPILGLPYPEGSDAPNGPAQFQALAEAVEDKIAIRQMKVSNIAAEQSRTNTVYDYLGTADKVTGIVLPTDGLIFVAYQALWKESVISTAHAALFVGANQVKARSTASGDPVVQEASHGNLVATYGPLASFSGGLVGSNPNNDAASADVTTGQIIGGISNLAEPFDGGACVLFADAGTYDVGVKFRSTSGSVTAKGRRLWVWTMAPTS